MAATRASTSAEAEQVELRNNILCIPSKWGVAVDLSNPDGISMAAANTWILFKVDTWKKNEIEDEDLFEIFREEFKGWEELFDKATGEALSILRNHMRSWGVVVPTGPELAKEQLAELLQLRKPIEWSQELLIKQKNRRSIGLRQMWEEYQQYAASAPHIQQSTEKGDSMISQNVPLPSDSDETAPNNDEEEQGGRESSILQTGEQNRGRQQSTQPQQPYQQRPGSQQVRVRFQRRYNTPDTQQFINSNQYQATPKTPSGPDWRQAHHRRYYDEVGDNPTRRLWLPDAEIPSKELSKSLVDLSKLYGNERLKYSGAKYQYLEQELLVFFDNCQKVGLTERDYAAGFSSMLTGRARSFYYDQLASRGLTFQELTDAIEAHFNDSERLREYDSEWRQLHLKDTVKENPEKTLPECVTALFEQIEQLQPGVTPEPSKDAQLRNRLLQAIEGVAECEGALLNPPVTYEGLCNKVRTAIGTRLRSRPISTNRQFVQDHDDPNDNHAHFTDRRYGGTGSYRGRGRGGGFKSIGGDRAKGPKKCWVCKKEGCWSTKHTPEERKKCYDDFKSTARYPNNSRESYHIFLIHYEGLELDEADQRAEEIKQHFLEYDSGNEAFLTTWNTEAVRVDGEEILETLRNQATAHIVTRIDAFDELPISASASECFKSNSRYSADVFQGILPDTGAANLSTAGYRQFLALQKILPEVKLEPSAGHEVTFGIGSAMTKGVVNLSTPIGVITFHVVDNDIPFLWCLADMDRMNCYIDNLRNVIVQGRKTVAIVRKFGHPFMLLDKPSESLAHCHLTEAELRTLHRRFGHPSVAKLSRLLKRAGQDFDPGFLEQLNTICHQCQLHQGAPGRFKFRLKDDFDFNYSIIADVVQIDGANLVHVIDESTSFQAAEWMDDNSSIALWRAIEKCWINTYLGPPEFIKTDAGPNFTGTQFKQRAKQLTIEVITAPTEAHNNIGKIERYHTPLRRAYQIIRDELKNTETTRAECLQMAVKAINDTAGPNGLVPTLLVFGAYPRMTARDPPTPSVIKRAKAIDDAMKELRRLQARRKVTDALRMRNGPDISPILKLPLPADVVTYREKGVEGNKAGWTGPFKMVAIEGNNCKIDTGDHVISLKATSVRPYYQDEAITDLPIPQIEAEPGPADLPIMPLPAAVSSEEEDEDSTIVVEVPPNYYFTMTDFEHYLTHKEQSDLQLSLKLRKEGIIRTPGRPFEEARTTEIDGLIATGVFRFIQHDPIKHAGVRIFSSRFVDEVKGKTTVPYEKSRLVIQCFGDDGKLEILTQSPTIQRVSQRLIIALAPSLILRGLRLLVRDITQAYTQASTLLQRLILSRPPRELQDQLPKGTLLWILKALYGIPEAGTHWYNTYHNHHIEKLRMVTSTYDHCLLVTTQPETFGLIGLQTDDTLILATPAFADLEASKLLEAKLKAKDRDILSPSSPITFNGGTLTMEGDSVILKGKGQGEKLKLVDAESMTLKQDYAQQRARAAWIASGWQPEASCSLSLAAQHQEPKVEDVIALNRVLQWQIDNLERGIKMVPLDLNSMKLFVFVDGSFAGNSDYTSQIGYLLMIGNEVDNIDRFSVTGNIIDYRSVKAQRVTRSTLASEVYGMTAGVDVAYTIGTTLKLITKQLALGDTQIVVLTDSYSLYECLVKLGSTKEKRLMIDIMAIRQSYERRELQEVRWIHGDDNPADAMTKAKPNSALKRLVDNNKLDIKVEGWVKRD